MFDITYHHYFGSERSHIVVVVVFNILQFQIANGILCAIFTHTQDTVSAIIDFGKNQISHGGRIGFRLFETL